MENFDHIRVDSDFTNALDLAQLSLGKRIAIVVAIANDGRSLQLILNPSLSEKDVATVLLSLRADGSKSL